jgi:tetratricopeptide (TPR) repeat protein
MSLQDAAEWFRQGQDALAAGRIDSAIDAFRRATVRNRTEKDYVLALARALALDHDDDAARAALMTLREAAPEDPDINLQLARLAVHRQDSTEALRFYHNALYAPWPAELGDERRGVRLELVRFLLAHHQMGRALSELLAVSDLPDRVGPHLEVGDLFAEVGEYGHALDQYERTLRLDPADGRALAGAGQSAFHLGQYALAQTYLSRAPNLDDVQTTRETVELVMTNDPLANRLGSAERRRRLTADLDYARRRLAECVAQRANGAATSDETALRGEAEDFSGTLKPSGILDADLLEMGMDLVSRIAGHVVQSCASPAPLDRAMVLIGRQHGDTK